MQKSQNILCVSDVNSAHITVGRLYTAIDLGYDRVDLHDMDNGSDNGGNYSWKYFKKLTDLSIEELIEVAKSLVGLKLLSPGGETYDITSWGISNDIDNNSWSVREDVKLNDVSVFIRFNVGCNVPIRDLHSYRVVYPALTEKVKLNKNYDAIVSKTDVVVGCQTFPISVVEKILEVSKKLQ
jgi:hypothetical protein